MIFIKHVRNKIKTAYTKDTECYICGSAEQLEFHHLMCLSILVKKLLRKEKYAKYPIDSDPRFDELAWKMAKHPDVINPEHHYTLCKPCHKGLHQKWGQNYTQWKAVGRYIEKLRVKHGH